MQNHADPKDALGTEVLAGSIRAGMGLDQKVWALTARVPRGRVTTYGRIAAALGCRSPRAVGGALGRNPYAPRVPCHRVVGADGRLSGYAGGLDRKRQLLEREGVAIHAARVRLRRGICFEFDPPQPPANEGDQPLNIDPTHRSPL